MTQSPAEHERQREWVQLSLLVDDSRETFRTVYPRRRRRPRPVAAAGTADLMRGISPPRAPAPEVRP